MCSASVRNWANNGPTFQRFRPKRRNWSQIGRGRANKLAQVGPNLAQILGSWPEFDRLKVNNGRSLLHFMRNRPTSAKIGLIVTDVGPKSTKNTEPGLGVKQFGPISAEIRRHPPNLSLIGPADSAAFGQLGPESTEIARRTGIGKREEGGKRRRTTFGPNCVHFGGFRPKFDPKATAEFW